MTITKLVNGKTKGATLSAPLPMVALPGGLREGLRVGLREGLRVGLRVDNGEFVALGEREEEAMPIATTEDDVGTIMTPVDDRSGAGL